MQKRLHRQKNDCTKYFRVIVEIKPKLEWRRQNKAISVIISVVVFFVYFVEIMLYRRTIAIGL